MRSIFYIVRLLMALTLSGHAASQSSAGAHHPTVAANFPTPCSSSPELPRAYLYAHANPVDGIDPSGHMNLVSVTVTLGALSPTLSYLAYRASPLLTRASVIAFEATTGQTIVAGGAGAIGVLSQLRNLPGMALGLGKAIVQGQWLRGSHGNLAPIPKDIAKQLSGRSFPNFDTFREAFWKLVAEDSRLVTEFSAQNIARMKQGLAPVAHSSQQVGGRISYELHHIKPVQHGGEVYNLDNIVIMTPRYHQEVLEASYHY